MFRLRNKKLIFWYTLLTKGLELYKLLTWNKLLISSLFSGAISLLIWINPWVWVPMELDQLAFSNNHEKIQISYLIALSFRIIRVFASHPSLISLLHPFTALFGSLLGSGFFLLFCDHTGFLQLSLKFLVTCIVPSTIIILSQIQIANFRFLNARLK